MRIEQKSTEKISQSFKNVGPYLGLGTQLAATVIIMFFLGKYLDDQLEFFPWLTISFSIIGAFAGIYNFIKTVLQINSKDKIDIKN